MAAETVTRSAARQPRATAGDCNDGGRVHRGDSGVRTASKGRTTARMSDSRC